jgi:hypothetical protein
MRLPLCHILEKLFFFNKQDEMEFKTKILQEFF